jgi:hypothetical protein
MVSRNAEIFSCVLNGIMLDDIWTDTVGRISNYLSTDTFKGLDLWYTATTDDFFDDPAGVKDSIHQYVLYCYALGDKAEDSLGGKRLQVGFCFIFGVRICFSEVVVDSYCDFV